MSAVWKFTISVTHEQVIQAPPIERWLHADLQAGKVCIWAVVDTSVPLMRPTAVLIRGTGHQFTGQEGEHIGTFQLDSLVFHVFAALREGGDDAT